MTPRRHIVLSLAIFASLLIGCERGSGSADKTASLERDNVLLITLDTTRADRIGCYGHAAASTPALDALAARGTLFERAYSQVPLTTPSHCSLFTGRYPKEHGVRNNGRGSLGESFPTLATTFKEHGYATGAFVAAFVLDKRYGLNRGFDVYDDDLGKATLEMQRMDAHRPGGAVTEPALRWLDSVKEQRFFCWLHYYDPHDPYEPPAEFRESHVDPYDGEIAFMDAQIKRVLDWLDTNRLTDRTLVIAVGDHGESFGEHGEHGHTNFLYETNLHVPLIFAHPGVIRENARVSSVVEVVDLFPTVLELFGWSVPQGLESRSLAGVFTGRELSPRASYAESLYVRDLFGWAEQRSLTSYRWKYISSTRPELYDLQADPAEKQNLVPEQPGMTFEMLTSLKQKYASMASGEAGAVALDESARRRLESLGYLSGAEVPEDFLTEGLLEPKDKIETIQAVNLLRPKLLAGEFAEVLPKLEIVAERNPDASMIHSMLGLCYKGLGRTKEAIRAFEKTVALSPTNPMVLAELGDALANSGRLDEAVELLKTSFAIDGESVKTRAHLAEALRRLGRMDEALPHCRFVFRELHPKEADDYETLSFLLANRGFTAEAVEHYRQAISGSPSNPQVGFAFNLAMIRMGHAAPAGDNLREMIQYNPEMGPALIQAGVDRAEKGLSEESKHIFELGVTIPPLAQDAHFNLAVLASSAGDVREAVRHYERVLEVEPSYEKVVGELSKIYLANRRIADAIRVLDGAVRDAQDNVIMIISLAHILATCQDGRLRDGSKALGLARHACELTDRTNPAALMTLAAAFAETGDFEKAVAEAREALEIAEENQHESLKTTIQSHLEVFLKGRPYRNPMF